MLSAIVCGSRTYSDYEYMCDKLEGYNLDFIIQGDARGADRIAKNFADFMGIPHRDVAADWSMGSRAGYFRNFEMANLLNDRRDLGDTTLVLAFVDKPLVQSRGTAMMCDLANDNRHQVMIYQNRDDVIVR